MSVNAENSILRHDQDPNFERIFGMVHDRTVVSTDRLYMLYQLASIVTCRGEIAEVGVYRGGSAKLLFEVIRRPIHLFDTFDGMPETDPLMDVHHAGDFADTSVENVKAYFAATYNSAQLKDVYFHAGEFPRTAYEPRDGFCFVHVDADIYRSVKDACEFFWPRVNRGGIMVFDDYGFSSCPGARIAVDEYFGRRTIYLPTGQCFVIST